MPLFERPDGELIENESPVRRMIPYLMRGRNEAAVYHDEMWDLTKTKPWIKEWNRNHDQAATPFHLYIHAAGRALNARPGLNRFVSGGKLYQRKGTFISFSAKKSFREDSPLFTVKLEMTKEESFDDTVKRIVAGINDPRKGNPQAVDKELDVLLKLPGPLLRAAMWAWRQLDKVNLAPSKMIAEDPLYSSLFVANLGSVGLDNTYHHLYEHGTIGLFAVLGTPGKKLIVGPDGQPAVKEMMQVRYTLDERINDGFYCATALRYAQRIFEDPERYVGPATSQGDQHLQKKEQQSAAAAPASA